MTLSTPSHSCFTWKSKNMLLNILLQINVQLAQPMWLLGTFWRERKVSLETLPDSNCFYSSEFGIFLHVRLGLILFLSSITRLFTLGIRNI
ncbi:hypothetical protein L2E82_33572 [Cichorium intybus]|uniref:Uncharacterized protein n=1 Tax=Cichorium intybus TaxID=13427 RepID=A0ACB9BKH6_CICIN|nr:hypothetical protein L2E82_33572 [Cichorium intybus]